MKKTDYSNIELEQNNLINIELPDSLKNDKKVKKVSNVVIDDIDKKYEFCNKERNEWSNIINDMAFRLRDVNKLVDVQVDLFSNRQILVERRSGFIEILNRYLKNVKEIKETSLRDYKTEENLLMKNANESKILLDSKNKEIDEVLALYENHLDFLTKTIETIDKMLFGVKNRISLFEYLERN